MERAHDARSDLRCERWENFAFVRFIFLFHVVRDYSSLVDYSHSTATDDRLLCGDPPASIEASLLETVDDVDLRDTVTLFFRPFRPYTYHCASLARSLSDNVTGSESHVEALLLAET